MLDSAVLKHNNSNEYIQKMVLITFIAGLLRMILAGMSAAMLPMVAKWIVNFFTTSGELPKRNALFPGLQVRFFTAQAGIEMSFFFSQACVCPRGGGVPS